MSSAPDDRPEYVAVICPVCRTRLYPTIREEVGTEKCPDCYTPVRVPSLAEVRAREGSRPRTRPQDVEPYRLSAVPEEPRPQAQAGTVTCESCGSRLNPLLDKKPRAMLCPHCYQPVAVPACDDQAPPTDRKRRRAASSDAADTTPASAPTHQSPFDVMAEIRREEPDPPPAWTFFSDVFNFPWLPGTWPRWILLSIGCSTMSLIWAAAWLLFRHGIEKNEQFAIVGVGFLMLPAVWITLWTLSYAAACCLPIVTETSAGCRRISEWPEPNWRDWMVELIYLAYQGTLVAAVALGLTVLLRQAVDVHWILAPATALVLFPIVLLSSMEADSPWVPLSGPVLRSLVKIGWAWGVFYVLIGALWGAWLGLALLGLRSAPLATAVLNGPLLATVMLVSARLLGRLAWRAIIAELPPEERPKPKKRRRPAAPAAAIPASGPARPAPSKEATPQVRPTAKPAGPRTRPAPEPPNPAQNPQRRKPAPPAAPPSLEADDDYWNLPYVGAYLDRGGRGF